jgi:hypothetical protein
VADSDKHSSLIQYIINCTKVLQYGNRLIPCKAFRAASAAADFFELFFFDFVVVAAVVVAAVVGLGCNESVNDAAVVVVVVVDKQTGAVSDDRWFSLW